MKKDVLAAICSRQQFEGCEEQEIDLMTQATLYEKKGKYYIIYEESELTGMEGTRTTVKMDGKTVSLIRSGAFASHMDFIENERRVGLYQTASGAMTVATYASRVQCDVDENGGRLGIDYTIEIDSSLVGCHRFEMVITPT